jgi:hypothetical protein
MLYLPVLFTRSSETQVYGTVKYMAFNTGAKRMNWLNESAISRRILLRDNRVVCILCCSPTVITAEIKEDAMEGICRTHRGGEKSI